MRVVNLWQEHRSIARFIGYALCAADEALRDAKWMPTEPKDKQRTVISENITTLIVFLMRVVMFWWCVVT